MRYNVTGGVDGRDFALIAKRNTANVGAMSYGGVSSDSGTHYNDTNVDYMVIGKFSDLGTLTKRFSRCTPKG